MAYYTLADLGAGRSEAKAIAAGTIAQAEAAGQRMRIFNYVLLGALTIGVGALAVVGYRRVSRI